MSGSSEAGFPREGRLLGLDFGTRRVGVAVSTPEQSIASPVDNYDRRTDDLDAKHFQRLIADYGVVGIIVGLPIHISGDESELSRQARKFGQWIGQITSLPVHFWDERYTSSIAESFLLGAELSKKKRKARLDKVAAQLMLQAYLERQETRVKRQEPDESDDVTPNAQS